MVQHLCVLRVPGAAGVRPRQLRRQGRRQVHLYRIYEGSRLADFSINILQILSSRDFDFLVFSDVPCNS